MKLNIIHLIFVECFVYDDSEAYSVDIVAMDSSTFIVLYFDIKAWIFVRFIFFYKFAWI